MNTRSGVSRGNRRQGGKTGEVRLDSGNYQERTFRTLLICQNRICQTIGANNASENGMTLYNHTGCENCKKNVD
jgi:hypothetical protein